MACNLPGDVVAARTAALRELALDIGKDFASLDTLIRSQLMFLAGGPTSGTGRRTDLDYHVRKGNRRTASERH